MTPDEVAVAMRGADKAFFSGTRHTPKWDGTIDVFIFRYGPPWRKPFTGKERFVYEEWYTVFYSTDGRAVKLEREMVKGLGRDVVLDLKTEEFH